MSKRLRCLSWLLRLLGVIDLLAVVVVVLPLAWIEIVHAAIGLGPLSDLPVTEYLIRICSALYALYGAFLLILSCDVVRYLPLIRWLGGLAILHGGLSLYIDTWSRMPVWWCCLEGPVFAGFGTLIMLLARDQSSESN